MRIGAASLVPGLCYLMLPVEVLYLPVLQLQMKPEMASPDVTTESTEKKPKIIRFCQWLSQKYQCVLDYWTPYMLSRWTATIILMIIYLVRVFYLKGWYITAYALGIYYFSLFIAFLSPKIDPADHFGDDGSELPTTVTEEFRPFIRRLPEFKFWYSATWAIFIAMFCTFFEAFNIPLSWRPTLLLQTIILLFCITMKRQIKHMIKYRYLPWTTGKAIYKGKEDTGKIVSA